MSVEMLLAFISAVVIPLIGCAVWLAGRIARLEAEIKTLVEVKTLENQSLDYRITKLEKHVHEIRNSVQTITLSLMAERYRADKNFTAGFDKPTNDIL